MVKNSTKNATATATAPATAPAPATESAPVVVKAPKTPKTKVAPVSAPAPAPAPAAAPAAADATPKKVRAPKSPKVDAAASTPATAPAASSEVAASTDASVDAHHVSSDFSGFSSRLQQVSALLSALKVEFRTLERKASRELKTATKAGAKRKRKTGNRSPSGFVKPTLISPELATFLGKSQGTEMARTEVTREINAYIRANSLQDKTNGRKINADSKLSSLLKLKADEELTYFNLQRYMSPHFQKVTATATAAAPVVA